MNEPYAPPPPLPPPPNTPTASNRATTSLVLGIIGVVCCTFCAPVAWYLGNQELLAIRSGLSPASGEGWATAGKVLGIVGTALLGLGLIAMVVWVVAFGGMMVLEGLGNHH